MSRIETNRKIELNNQEDYKGKNKHFLYFPQARVAYLWEQFKKTGKGGRLGKIKTVYIAFDNLDQCQEFEQTAREHYGQYRVQGRCAKRVLDWRYEVKIQGDFSIEEIEGILLHVESNYPEEIEGSYEKEIKISPITPIKINLPKNTAEKRVSTVIANARIGNWQLASFANLTKEQRRSRAYFC